MDRKLPSLQFYPGDWKKDPGVQALDLECRGFWMELLFLMHESSERGVLLLNGKPFPIEALASMFNLVNQKVESMLTKLLEYGVAHKREDGAIFNKRMIRDEQIREVRLKAGLKGGNPILVNQKATKIKKAGKPLANQNTEDEDEDEDEIENRSKKRIVTIPGDLPVEAREDLQRWLDYRTAAKKPIKTKDSINELIKKYWEWGPGKFRLAVSNSIANGWQGLFEPKDTGKPPAQSAHEKNLAKLKELEAAGL